MRRLYTWASIRWRPGWSPSSSCRWRPMSLAAPSAIDAGQLTRASCPTHTWPSPNWCTRRFQVVGVVGVVWSGFGYPLETVPVEVPVSFNCRHPSPVHRGSTLLISPKVLSGFGLGGLVSQSTVNRRVKGWIATRLKSWIDRKATLSASLGM